MMMQNQTMALHAQRQYDAMPQYLLLHHATAHVAGSTATVAAATPEADVQ